MIEGGYKRCIIEMTYMTEYPETQNYIMLGGMFFHDFFTVFQNQYTSDNVDYAVQQTARIYAS